MKKNIIIRDHLHGKNSSLVFFHRHKICWMKWNKASEMISALLMTPPRYARLVYSFFKKSFALKISFALWKLNSAAGFTARISESRQTQRVFLPPWSHQVGSTACSHSVNCIHTKVLLSSTYTETGATGLNLPSDLSPVIQKTAAKTWGQLFCWCVVSLCIYPCCKQ